MVPVIFGLPGPNIFEIFRPAFGHACSVLRNSYKWRPQSDVFNVNATTCVPLDERIRMSKKRPLYQDPEGSYDRIAAKKTRFAPSSESDGRKGSSSIGPRNAMSANRRPLDRYDPKDTRRQGRSTSDDATDATRQGNGLRSTREVNSLESQTRTGGSGRDVNTPDLLSGGLSVQWYSSEGRKDAQTAFQGCSKDSSPAGDCSGVELCRTFLASLKQSSPFDASLSAMQNSEEVAAGLMEEPVSLGLQGRGETATVRCSFIGRDVQPSTTDLIHPDLPVSPFSLFQALLFTVYLSKASRCDLSFYLIILVQINLPQDPTSSSSSTTSSTSSTTSSSLCCPESASHQRHFPSDHLLYSAEKKAATLHYYKIVLSPSTNFNVSGMHGRVL